MIACDCDPKKYLSVDTTFEFTGHVCPRLMQTTPYDGPGTLVYRCQRSWWNSTVNWGSKQRWGKL